MTHQYNDLAFEFNKGSKTAFTTIYKLLYHSVFLFSKRLIQSDEAADITAEVFYKLWMRHENFNSFIDIRAFVFITARNACFDYLKHKKVKARTHREIFALSDKEESIVIRSEIESEVIRQVKVHLKSLASQEAKVLSLSILDGYKNSEICEMLQISDKTVRNLKAAALKKMRTAILKQDLKKGLVTISATALTMYVALILFEDVIY